MSSLQQGVGCALSLVVGLVFSPSLLSLHVSLTPKSSPPDRGQHYHRTLSVITTSGAHWKWSLSSGAQKEHTLQRVSQAASKVAMLIYFSISYVLKVFFFFFLHWVKNKKRKTFFFQVWVIAFDLFSTALKKPVLPDSPTAEATPWAAQYIPWEAAPALSLSYQLWRGSDRISGGSSGSSSNNSNNSHLLRAVC